MGYCGYKTDTVHGKDELNRLVEYYRPQLIYTNRFWEDNKKLLSKTLFYSVNEYIRL